MPAELDGFLLERATEVEQLQPDLALAITASVSHYRCWKGTLHNTPAEWDERDATAYRRCTNFQLALLGLMFAHHPDYDESWGP